MKKNRDFLNGLLTATVAVAEVTGPIKIADLNEQTWQVITKINLKLLELATAEAERLEGL